MKCGRSTRTEGVASLVKPVLWVACDAESASPAVAQSHVSGSLGVLGLELECSPPNRFVRKLQRGHISPEPGEYMFFYMALKDAVLVSAGSPDKTPQAGGFTHAHVYSCRFWRLDGHVRVMAGFSHWWRQSSQLSLNYPQILATGTSPLKIFRVAG